MKKHLLFVPSFLLTFQLAMAQVPNAGFETWNTVSMPPFSSYEEPAGWNTFNSFSAFGTPTTVTKSTDKQSGNYAMKVATVAYTTKDPSNPSETEFDTLGGLAIADFATSQRIRSLSGFYKCAPGVGDTVMISAIAVKTTNGEAETIGQGFLREGENVSTFKSFRFNINYISEETPDTIIILVMSSTSKAVAGSYIIVDDLSVSTVANTMAPLELNSSNIYPNPVSGEITIDGIYEEASRIEFVSVTGLPLTSITVTGKNMNISVADYASGLYFFNVYDKENRWIQRGKFSVK